MAIADVTYFNSTLEDEIVIEYLPPNFDAHPYNSSVNSPRDGVEAALSLRLTEQWRIDASYTYLHSEENGEPEVRRARRTSPPQRRLAQQGRYVRREPDGAP